MGANMCEIKTKRLVITKSTHKDAPTLTWLLLSHDRKILTGSVYMKDLKPIELVNIVKDGISNNIIWTIREKETGFMVGSLSFNPIDKEVGGWISVEYHGKGYGRESFSPFIDMILQKEKEVYARHSEKIVCNTFAKCGMTRYKTQGMLEIYIKKAPEF